MAALESLDLADLVAGTLRDLGRMKVQNIAQSLQRYEVFPIWFKKNKVTFDEGIGIQRNLMNRVADCAAHRGLTDTDQSGITDIVDQLQVPWRQLTSHWQVIYQEVLENRGAARIFDLIKLRRQNAMLAMVEKLESKAWSLPGASDKVNPYGVPYWIVKNNSTGFNGGAPSGHTTVGGVSLTDSPTFKNYTAQYTAVTKADLIKKMRDMHYYTGFQSPVDLPDYTSGSGQQYRVYTNRAVTSTLEEIGEAQNENLGRDIASVDGVSLVFRKNPIRTIPVLDADTTNPVYFIDHGTFYPVCMKGDYFRETKTNAPEQHDIVRYFMDLRYNYVCVDRRRNGVIATNT